MDRRTVSPIAISLLTLTLVAASAQQGVGEFLADRWWIWLVVLTLFLVISFFLVLGADFTESGRRSGDEQDES